MKSFMGCENKYQNKTKRETQCLQGFKVQCESQKKTNDGGSSSIKDGMSSVARFCPDVVLLVDMLTSGLTQTVNHTEEERHWLFFFHFEGFFFNFRLMGLQCISQILLPYQRH